MARSDGQHMMDGKCGLGQWSSYIGAKYICIDLLTVLLRSGTVALAIDQFSSY